LAAHRAVASLRVMGPRAARDQPWLACSAQRLPEASVASQAPQFTGFSLTVP